MNKVTQDARALSSGTIAGLIHECKYSIVDKVQAVFINFCEKHEGEFETWVQAWHEFDRTVDYRKAPAGQAFPLGKKVYQADRVNLDTGRPWTGYVMAINDPLVWTNTLAFYGTPTQEEVDAHLVYCRTFSTTFETDVPVQFEFGRILWEPADQLIEIQDYDLVAGEGAPQYTFLSAPNQQLTLI